jgi:hypothetical protein
MKAMTKAEEEHRHYVWDQLRLVESLTDLYIKNKSTEEGYMKGMLGEQLSMGLNKTIHAELSRLLIAIEECNDEDSL